MGDLFFYLGEAGWTMHLDASPQALEAALYQRRPQATHLCFIRTRRLRASIPAYPDYRTAFTFIHANTAHIYPYFFSYAFCI